MATTEPVADYLLQAAGTVDMTPWAFQADVMNGTDPSAQDVAVQRSLFTGRKVKIFLYNQQVTDSLTESYINLAHASGIPVVGVYETMPTPATTTSPGCWPRCTPWTRPWPARPPPSTYDPDSWIDL